MKRRLIAFVGIFCIAILIVSGVDARMNPDKPDKPPGKSHTEWIEFWGDLEGSQPVDGCCPNAGPFPPYRMCLNFEVGGYPAGTCLDGQLFINNYGAGRNHKYIVQFWNDDLEIFIEIIGGVIEHDRKNKILTVTFENEECVEYWTGTTTPVTFTLVRYTI